MAEQEHLTLPVADEDLMQRVGTGDDEALATLIDRWKNPLINFFYRSLQSYEQSEDLAQMVYIRLYRAAPKYRPTAKFSTFLFHIARRLLINEYRRRTRKPLDTVDPKDLKASYPGRTELNVIEIEEAFVRALDDLPENQKTAILLLKQQELSYQEIAEAMEATESAVKTWIFRARKHLKSALKGLFENEPHR
jgi:RNA polymerase sigma-70 factor (ECF subfamily)